MRVVKLTYSISCGRQRGASGRLKEKRVIHDETGGLPDILLVV